MKPLIKFITLIGMLASLTACHPDIHKSQCPPDCPEEDTLVYPLKKIWESNYFDHNSPKNGLISVGEVEKYKDILIYNGWPPYEDDIFRIFFFNAKTGKRLKEYKLGLNTVRDMEIIDKYLVIASFDGGFVFDLENLTLVKKLALKFDGFLAQFDNSVYLIANYGSIPYTDSTSLIKLDIPSLKTEKVLTITREEYGGFSGLNTVSFEVVENGDTMIYGTFEALHKFLYSYNKTKRQFVWQTRAKGGDFYYSHPLYDDKNIYITNNLGAEAYDKLTGELVWRTVLTKDGNWFRGTEPLFLNGRLYLKASNDKLFCLDSKDGSIIWENDRAGGALSNRLSYYRDMIYYGSQGNTLRIIDMNTGEELLNTVGPYTYPYYSTFDSGYDNFEKFESISPYIDSTAGVFYMTDRHRMFCFKLLEK